jgi:tetratricopeptide (TPR) repeat protein
VQLTIRAAAAGAAMMVAAHWCSSLHAQTQQQVDACEGKGNLPLDTVTGSCTALIQSGNYLARDLSTVFVIRAIACQRKGDLDRAIQDYDHAIGLDPGGATAYYNRGAAYGSKGDWDRAILDYDQAIRHQPNDSAAFRNRGLAYQEKKQFDRAFQDFDRAVRLDPLGAYGTTRRTGCDG